MIETIGIIILGIAYISHLVIDYLRSKEFQEEIFFLKKLIDIQRKVDESIREHIDTVENKFETYISQNEIEKQVEDFRKFMKNKNYSNETIGDYGAILRNILNGKDKNKDKYISVKNLYKKYKGE